MGYPLEILAPEPVSRKQLYLAHDKAFVDGVLDGQQANGFGNRSKEVAASLPYTTGSMLAAARAALANGKGAVSPSSGFHHADHNFAGGFCTFNGLMVTVMVLLSEGALKRVAILDLDEHWGNDSDDIIKKRNLADVVEHHSAAIDRRQAES